MIELRWKVGRWDEYPEFGHMITRYEEPVLQYKEVVSIDNSDMNQTPVWSEWTDVPTEYVDV